MAKKKRKWYFPRCCNKPMEIIRDGAKGIGAKLKCIECGRKI